MTQGANYCQWPGCDELAITHCRTVRIPGMMLCKGHRRAWDEVPYGVLVDIAGERQPIRAVKTGPHPVVPNSLPTRRWSLGGPRRPDGKRGHPSRGPS